MKIRILSWWPIGGLVFVMGLLAPAPRGFSETEDRIEKAFQLPAGGRLVVDADVGSIRVRGSTRPGLSIEIVRHVRARNAQRERAILDAHQVHFEQSANEVMVRARRNESFLRRWRRNERYHVTFTIEAPESTVVDLRTAGGGIVVENLTGKVKARTSGGSLKFSLIEASVDGKTSGGGITVDRCTGDIHASTAGGSIHLNECTGNVDVTTSGGGIRVEDLHGNVEATTSGGSITASLLAPLTRDCRLETSGGRITVRLPSSAAFDLDAATSGGGVRSELPVTSGRKPHGSSLHGKVNGGGKVLRLRSSGGSINVRRL
jgi:DUF4097 and DUF4098 domain-containing protein YvlB